MVMNTEDNARTGVVLSIVSSGDSPNRDVFSYYSYRVVNSDFSDIHPDRLDIVKALVEKPGIVIEYKNNDDIIRAVFVQDPILVTGKTRLIAYAKTLNECLDELFVKHPMDWENNHEISLAYYNSRNVAIGAFEYESEINDIKKYMPKFPVPNWKDFDYVNRENLRWCLNACKIFTLYGDGRVAIDLIDVLLDKCVD